MTSFKSELILPVEIHGRPLNGQTLTPEILKDLGLDPITKIEISGREILLSSGFETPRNRLGCITYVRDGEKYIARTFFFSRSQGVWRLLRRYRFEIRDGQEHVTWHDKGFNEESLLVPLAIQKEIARLDVISNGSEELELAFYGTCLSVDEADEYAVLVDRKPRKLQGNFYPEQRRQKIAPELLRFDGKPDAPNFESPILRWEQQTLLYGSLQYFVFESNDHSLKYLFIKTRDNRAWIGGVESDGKVTSLGIRNFWVSAANIATPLYEYLDKWDEESGKFLIDQTAGYGNPDDRKGHYVDMWKNYLSKVTVLQEFMKY